MRLHADFFDFSQAKAGGDDIRFSTAAGEPLPYQVEEWDAARGTASIWVRIPRIRGNERQEIRLRWGNPGAASESRGADVFGAGTASLQGGLVLNPGCGNSCPRSGSAADPS